MNFVDNRVDPGSGTVRARAVCRNPDRLITPGQFGRMRMPGSPEYDGDPDPRQAIVTDQSQQLVMTVDRGRHGRAAGDPAGPARARACASSARGLEAEDGSSSTG